MLFVLALGAMFRRTSCLLLFAALFVLGTTQPVIARLGPSEQPRTQSETPDADFVANALYDSAVEATRIGDYSRAIRLLTKVVEMRPDFAEAYRERGFAYLYQGAAKERIAPCTRTLQTQGRSFAKLLERGNAHFGAGNYEAALADYDEAAKLRPDDPEPSLRRSRVFLSRGERERSRTEWDVYVKKIKAQLDKKRGGDEEPAPRPRNGIT